MDKQKCASEKTTSTRSLHQYFKNHPNAFAFLLTIIVILFTKMIIQKLERRSIIAYMEKAIFLQMLFIDGAIEDLFDLTDSEDSSSSSNTGVFESHQPFVLELHDLVKDEPAAGTDPQQPKLKKQKKKKLPGVNQTASSETSSSVSESSVPPTGLEEHSKEEFYDAHESYHGLTENQLAANPVTTAGLMQARSEHGAAPKLNPEQTLPQTPGQPVQPVQPGSGSRREPSTITKPATGPQ